MSSQFCTLIIEDETELSGLLSRRLANDEIKALTCPSVPIAIKMLANQRFDCIVLDIQLRQGSGEQVIAAIRSNKQACNHHTPILVISAHLNSDLLQRIAPEIQGALVKPFQRDAFAEKVRQFCRMGALRKTAA